MMSDYERVIELQQISARSAGATSAQMSVYLTGMAAAVNKFQVSYEKLISSVTNSDFIIGIVDTLANTISNIADNLLPAILITLGSVLAIKVAIAIQDNLSALAAEKNLAMSQYQLLIESGLLKEAALLTVQEKLRELQAKKTTIWMGIQKALANQILVIITAAVAVVTAITFLLVSGLKPATERATEEVSKLSAEIYHLTTVSNAIDEATDKFDELDNKIIKTRKDLEEASAALDSVADKLSSSESDNILKNLGMSEQDYYNNLTTDSEKKKFLEEWQAAASVRIQDDRLKQIANLRGLTASERAEALQKTSNVDALKANNNQTLYDTIDKQIQLTTEQKSAVESLTQSILEELSAEQAYEYSLHPEKIKKLTNAIADLTTKIDDTEYSLAEVLEGDDFSLKDKVAAYNELTAAISYNKEALDILKVTYGDFEVFTEMDEQILQFIDDSNLSITKLNDLYRAWEKLQRSGIAITKDEWQASYDDLLKSLSDSNMSIKDIILNIYGDYLSEFEEGSEGWYSAYNAFVNAWGNVISQGILNMGQTMDTFTNQINSIYEKAAKWSSMSASEQAEFISDNYDLFSGEDGAKLLEAFKTGNYDTIENALKNNETLAKKTRTTLKQVEDEIRVQEALAADQRNEAYLKQLYDYKSYLEDSQNLYRADLKTRLEQEQNQIDEYKNMLQDQQKALEDSLNKRKDAYQKYFDAINKEQEDEEFEQTEATIIDNISKLSASTSAIAINKTAELEKKLTDLENERLKTLRERAQEEIISNIEDELEDISDKFDELLNSQQLMLNAMLSETENPYDFISKLVTTKATSEGLTVQGLEDYLSTLQTTFGAILGSSVFENVMVNEENGNIVLNVNGQSINLSQSDNDQLFNLIKAALQQIGF